MKDVIDVMQLQREKSRQVPAMDYTETENNFIAVRFIFECGIKLDAQPLTIATAAVLYHRFFKETDSTGYDSYLIAATALYLAGKVKDDPLKIRDVINVTHNTLHRASAPLELGDEYWNMRDAIVQAELLIMRMLKFEVTIVHPHKYQLHYLKSLEGWFSKEEWNKIPLAKASFAFLQDFHFDASILDYSPQHVAVACINLALQCYGVQVPYTDEGDGGVAWYSDERYMQVSMVDDCVSPCLIEGATVYCEPGILHNDKDFTLLVVTRCNLKAEVCNSAPTSTFLHVDNKYGEDRELCCVFTDDLQKDKLWEIMEKIMEVYDKEKDEK